MTTAGTAQKHGQARRDELRTQVLSVVEKQLRSGATYADINVASVVAEAGISRSTFYAYFVDKTNLLRIWYAEFTQVILDAAQTWWSLDGSATIQDVRAALERIMDAYRAHPELMAATHEAIGTDHGLDRTAKEEAASDQYTHTEGAECRQDRNVHVPPSWVGCNRLPVHRGPR